MINLHLDNKSLDIHYLTALYTADKPKEEGHEAAVAHYDKIREQFL